MVTVARWAVRAEVLHLSRERIVPLCEGLARRLQDLAFRAGHLSSRMMLINWNVQRKATKIPRGLEGPNKDERGTLVSVPRRAGNENRQLC